MTFEEAFVNAEKLTKEFGKEVGDAFKGILVRCKNEGKTAEEAVKWIGDKFKEMK